MKQKEKTEVVTKTVKKEIQEEVTTTKQVETKTTKTTTTEIVNEEPIIGTTTKTVYEEVPSTKEMRVETVVDSAYDEETGEIVYTKEEKTITVPTTETVAKEETVEGVIGTNYTVRETVNTEIATADGKTDRKSVV